MTTPIELTLDELLGHEAWLRSLLRSLLNEGEVDDVLQQTWMAALRSPPADAGALRTWLARVAQNFARQTRRSEQRRTVRESAVAKDVFLPSTEETLMQLAVQRRVTESVDRLDEPYRTTILLRYFHHLNTVEIAERMATNENNVRQRLFRGHAKLRAELESEYGDDWRRSKALLALALPSAETSGAVETTTLSLSMNKPIPIAAAAILILSITYTLWPSDIAAPVSPPTKTQTTSSTAAAPDTTPTADRVLAGGTTTDTDTWRGRVVDTNGTPLAAVPIGYAFEAGSSQPDRDGLVDFKLPLDGSLAFKSVGQTDSQGAFAIQALPEGMILRVGGNYAPVRSWRVDARQQNLLLVASPAISITGTVVDADGRPMADIKIDSKVLPLTKLALPVDRTLPVAYSQSITDAQGRFELRGLPATQMELSFITLGYMIRLWEVGVRDELGIEIDMLRIANAPRTVSGIVVDPQQRPIAGVPVGIAGQSAKTDHAGRFEVVFQPGDYMPIYSKLFASKRGVQTEIIDLGTRVMEGNISGEKIVLGKPTLAIRGRLKTAAGKPSAGQLVFVWDGTSTDSDDTAENLAADASAEMLVIGGYPIFAGARTDDAGRFTITGLGDRPYRLRVFDKSKLHAFTTEPIAAGTTDLALRWPADLLYHFRGHLHSADGSPAGGVTISVGVVEYELDGNSLISSRTLGKTDPSGHFDFTEVPGYDAILSFSGKGYISRQRQYEPKFALPDVELQIDRAVQVRILDIPTDGGLLRLRFKLAAGGVLDIEDTTSQLRGAKRYPIDGPSTPVLITSERAAFVEFFDASDAVVHTMGITLQPGEITTLSYR